MSTDPETFEAFRRADGEHLWDEFAWVTFDDWDDAESSLVDGDERFELERVRMTVEVVDSRMVGAAEEPCDEWIGRPARHDEWFAVIREGAETRDPSRLLFGQPTRESAERMLAELQETVQSIDVFESRVVSVPKSEYEVVDCSKIIPASACENCGHELAAHATGGGS